MRRLRVSVAFIACLLLVGYTPLAFAQYNSGNYSAEEVFFGSGGELESSSANYKAKSSVGALGVGNVNSANYRATAGFISPDEPYISMVINTSSVDLGTLTTGSAKTGTATFSVSSYLTSSYTVLTMSNPPTSESGAILTGMSSAAASSPGTEQFGINLVANTSPTTFGANPVNQPDSTFADGGAATGYDTTNLYKYVVGDTVARSAITNGNQAIGQTNYTISYIANSKLLTRAGLYTMNHDLVAVGTF